MAQNNQKKLIDIIVKINPKINAGDAAQAYRVLKELEKENR